MIIKHSMLRLTMPRVKLYRTKNNGNTVQCFVKEVQVGKPSKEVLCKLVELDFDFEKALEAQKNE